MKRKFISLVTVLAMMVAFVVLPTAASAASGTLKLGDYVQMGTYYDEPILWRVVSFEKITGYDDDGNPIIDSTDTVTTYQDGYLPLMLADKIICLKPFDAGGTDVSGSHSRESYRARYGSNYWADSNMRSWLNSSESAGNVTWLCENPPLEDYVYLGYDDYADEAGFLTNFTENELNAVKPVTQKSIVSYPEYKNGIYDSGSEAYDIWLESESPSISSVVLNYGSAYSEHVTDTMFLLDVKQVNSVYNNSDVLGSNYHIGEPTEQCVENSEYTYSFFAAGNAWYYWLRSPYAGESHTTLCVYRDYVFGSSAHNNIFVGVRPAFFFDPESFSSLDGEGTSENPYNIPTEDVSISVSTAQSGFVTTTFNSTVSDWAAEEIEEAYQKNLIPEVLVGTDLTKKVNRAEFAAIAVKLYENLSESTAAAGANPFTDIAGNACENEILKAYNLDITVGTEENLFSPNELITREQVATMLTRAYKRSEFDGWTLENDSQYYLNSMGVQIFADDDEISDYAKESVYFMVKWGVINGVGDNKFAPNGSSTLEEDYGYATREQAIAIALRSAKYL